jgi:type I restriction enzyme S subunit
LGDLADFSKEKAAPKNISDDMLYIGLEHIEKETGELLGSGNAAEVRSTKARFRKGELLYGKLRPYLNKVLVAKADGICSTDILVMEPRAGVAAEFLKYRMLSEDFVRYANGNVNGVQHPRVNQKTVSLFDVELPPLAEQRRIVEKIEELFTRLDTGVESLEKTKVLLKKYRQSVLKAAVTGELSREWREEHGDGD